MPEITLVMLKPPCMQLGLVGSILRYWEDDLKIILIRQVLLTSAQVEEMYGHVSHLPMFPSMIHHYTTGPSVVVLLEGPNAIQAVRDSLPELRAAYGNPDLSYDNRIHASDSAEALFREAKLLLNLSL